MLHTLCASGCLCNLIEIIMLRKINPKNFQVLILTVFYEQMSFERRFSLFLSSLRRIKTTNELSGFHLSLLDFFSLKKLSP